MPTISVAMIVKNEAQDLANCLDTVKDWVDEIIILDSGSTDNTKEIALSYGAKFYENSQWPGFGKQRQLAQQYVTSDYVLWLDADERVTPKLQQAILSAVKNDRTFLFSENNQNIFLIQKNKKPDITSGFLLSKTLIIILQQR